MTPAVHRLAPLLVLLGAIPSAARTETFHTCRGFIDSVPATISTSGTWCLRADLSTAISSGEAITIAANNVTLDCNDFKLGGLAAGPSSFAVGIRAIDRQNIRIRNCVVRGFGVGILLSGDSLHVENNLLDNNLQTGIGVSGAGMVRGNAVHDTGGRPGDTYSQGISSSSHVIDNTISGVFATAANSSSNGIRIFGRGVEVRANRISGLMASGTGAATGINLLEHAATIADNRIVFVDGTAGYGIRGAANAKFCMGNTVADAPTPFDGCIDAGGNASY